jgi:translation initiation factor 2 beta subunit (eIF-2beta)/eIF-5
VEKQTLSPEDIQDFINDFVEEYKKYCDNLGEFMQ